MENLDNDIRNVISTLEGLEIKSTYENMNRLLGCMQVLERVRDELKVISAKETKGDKDE